MHYDVVILGGGFVGHTLQRACEKLGLTTCLVDAKPPVFQPGSDGRAIALSYTSVALLKNLHVWDELSSVATAIDRVHVSAQGKFGTMVCEARALGIPYLGQVVPAPLLGQALVSKDTFVHDTVTALSCSETCATVTLQQRVLTASLVLACDGTASFCRDYLHMETAQQPSHKKAIVMNMQLKKSHDHQAYQRLTGTGVCALLPLTDHKVTAVLSLDDAVADSMHALSDKALSRALQTLWGGRFGAMPIVGPRFMYPLTQLYVNRPISERVILMGNAAHTLNPIAAQGLNLAYRDIAVLYDILNDAEALSRDLGAYVPDVYLSRIQPAHQRMQRVTDALVNMAYAPPLSPFQGMGLSLLQHIPFIKNKWAAAFAGLDGHGGQLMSADIH